MYKLRYFAYQDFTFVLSGVYVVPFFVLGFLCKSLTQSLLKSFPSNIWRLGTLSVNFLFALITVCLLSTSPVENYYWFPTIYLSSSLLILLASIYQQIDSVFDAFFTRLKSSFPFSFDPPISLSSLPLLIYLSHIQVIYLIKSMM